MSDVTLLTSLLSDTPADRTAWLALADALREADRTEEADLIQSTERVAIEDGEVVELPSYRLEMRDDGGSDETVEFDDEPTAAEIAEACEEWARGGEWGSNGASISVGWTLTRHLSADDDESGEEVAEDRETVEIEPDHDALIRQATGGWNRDGCGNDPDNHDWTSEGEGGLDENPGVWSTGGTSMSFASHCRACGLKRRAHHCGSQRNPGEHDTVSYEMPGRWCAECQSEDCECESDDAE